MKAGIKIGDVLAEPADALVYSTNISLNLTGGVGAQLLERYGPQLQRALYDLLKGSGRNFAQQDDVFELVLPEMPYRMVFHTCPCDPMYHTDVHHVNKVIRDCLARCVALGNIRTVAMSALATGYGDLSLADFRSAFFDAVRDTSYSSLERVMVCIPEFAARHTRVDSVQIAWTGHQEKP